MLDYLKNGVEALQMLNEMFSLLNPMHQNLLTKQLYY